MSILNLQICHPTSNRIFPHLKNSHFLACGVRNTPPCGCPPPSRHTILQSFPARVSPTTLPDSHQTQTDSDTCRHVPAHVLPMSPVHTPLRTPGNPLR